MKNMKNTEIEKVDLKIVSVSVPRDQVEILLAFKNEFPSRNCDRKLADGVLQSPSANITSWTKDANSFDGVSFDEKTGAVTELNLRGACINGTIKANSNLFRFQHLRYLSLSMNHFDTSSFHAGFGRLTNLEYLDLSQNGFIGQVTSSISNLSRLNTLDLSYNKFTGPFPNIQNLTLLSYIDLSNNDFSGTVPSYLFTMPSLWYINLRQNHLTHPREDINSSETSKLQHLDMANNLLSCRILEPISKLAKLTELDLSFQNTPDTINFDSLPFKSLESLDLSGNVITRLNIGKAPSLRYNSFLSNAFHGSFPMIPPTMQTIYASNNHFTGDIPLSLCNASGLGRLDLSNNNFSGSIPRCLISKSLGTLKLHNNNLIGTLPYIEKSGLQILDVGHNQISGKLPRSLVNCTSLMFLNVENNRINDTFPFWLKALPDLQIIVLRSNRFHGLISSPRSHHPFPALRILDISHNNFYGSLPGNYFANWSSPLLKIPRADYPWLKYTGEQHSTYTPEYYPSIYMRNKGLNMELEKIPEAFTAIAISGNRLGGEIPESVGLLKSLIMLDLSNNSFTGHLPSSLANLKQLESLDLSQNQLSGEIPQELRVLTFLAYLNVSHNKLTGQIPQSTQIVGQPKASFEGNMGLCGLPLQESCFRDNVPTSTPQTPEKVLNWEAAAIGYGPGVLFGLAIGQALALYKPMLFYKLFRL
uniref:Leucine-rich repeat-containing N-terminal plant-type domain-containing protein n=2 Tax=Brassica oleracea var. oleracea TaxID=109376 RepID=A0A0D3BS67_BRAOL